MIYLNVCLINKKDNLMKMHNIIIRSLLLLGFFSLWGCIQEPLPNQALSVISFRYPDSSGIDQIAQESRIDSIDYWVFDARGALYVKSRVKAGDSYKNIAAELPEEDFTIVAWANLSQNELLSADPVTTLDDLKVVLAKEDEKYDARSGAVYQGMATFKTTQEKKEYVVDLKHKHANIAVQLEGKGIVSGSRYTCELSTGENVYSFREAVKIPSETVGYQKAEFVPRAQGANGKQVAALRTFRLFRETDKNAAVQIFKDGLPAGEPKLLSEILQEDRVTANIYDMYEQNLTLYIRIDGQGNMSFSINLFYDWNDGGSGEIIFPSKTK